MVVRRGRVASLLELGVGFHPERTGRENALLTATLHGMNRAEVEAQLDDVAAFADIGEFFDLPVRTYSTGMFMRVAFAAQTITRPDIWLIDEALSVGDFVFRQRALEWLRQFLDGGGTLILATHDTGLVESFCDRGLVLEQGVLVHDGPVAGATQLYITRYSQLGVTGSDADLPELPAIVDPNFDLSAFLRYAMRRPPDSDYLAKRVELLGTAVESVMGEPATSFLSGETMRVRSAFVVHEARPHVTNTLVLHHESGSLVWGAGVVNKGRLMRVEPGRTYISTIEVDLELAPGDYWLSVGLATANLDTNARTGEFHDRFVNVTAIHVIAEDLTSVGVTRLPAVREPLRRVVRPNACLRDQTAAGTG